MNNQELIERLWTAERANANDLRAAGLTVAVHNDYRQAGKNWTFWLFTAKHDGQTIAINGEGNTDTEALDQVRGQWARIIDKRHHAPMCPANHYHGQRAPTGQCSCGAPPA